MLERSTPLTAIQPNNAEARLLEALASLNRIGAAINRLSPGDALGVEETLRLIAESAIKVVPGASAVIYAYDAAQGAFDPDSCGRAGETGFLDFPDRIGVRAIGQRRRVLSYEEPDLEIHPAHAQAGVSAVACFPLAVAEQAVGALYVYLRQDRRFSQLELLMLDNFVNQAAMAIYQTRRLALVQRNLARKEDELNRLRRAGLLISSRLRLEETLEAILQMALEVTGAHYGIFRLVDRGGQNLIARAIAGEGLARPRTEVLPIDDHSVMGWVAQHRQSVCVQDLRTDPWRHVYYPLDSELEMRSELAVPLIGASGRLEGVLNLESPAVGAFSEEDSHLLQEIAKLLLVQTCQQTLSRLAELACDLLNAAASAIWLLKDDQLILQVASAGYQRGEFLPLSDSLTGQAVLKRSTIRADDVRSDPRFHRPDLARAQNWGRALIVPLLASDDGKPLGAFSVYSAGSDPGRFAESEWDEKVLTCLAHYAALAVHNAAHQEALRVAQGQHAVAETFAAVGDIAANVLHHLNNKVGTIPVRVQGIQDKCRTALLADVYLATNLAEIERSAGEAMEAIRENLSHLHPIQLAPVDVAACVAAAIADVRLPPGVRVQVQDIDHLPPVIAGQRSLTLVFTNLLENANDAMKGEGVVSIRGAARDSWVEIAISDSGPGIPPEWHDRIFELSFSGRKPARAGGLGFGLWWVKTLMARLGGSVSVESDGRHGSTFRLKLPCAEGKP